MEGASWNNPGHLLSMSASSSSSPAAAPSVSDVSPAAPAAIDASCRMPVIFLFACAAAWLVVASGLGLIASLKFHAPNLLADCPWFTYGRVLPAQMNALVYGFAAQAGLGATLWMIARLGRTLLVQPGYIVVGAILWNVGIKIGVIGIL